MKRATPYLNFPGNTEDAFAFYRDVFGGEFSTIVRYRDMGMAGDDEGDLIAHIALPIADDTALMGSDVSRTQANHYQAGNNIEIHLAATDAAEARRVFAALSDGGVVAMQLEPTSWSELFGSCVDRFGVHWMVDYAGEVPSGTA